MNTHLSDLQKLLLEMMKWFHELCRDNDLTYYALGGTMLGAVRHQGFIPWDDDVDVGMPRKDYEKFIEIMQTQEYHPYIIETAYSQDEAYCYPYAKVYNRTTTLVENMRVPLVRGVFLDIFPLDGIGNSEEESRRNYRSIKWLYNLLLTRTCSYRKDRGILKNTAISILSRVPVCIVDNKRLRRKIDQLCKAHSYDEHSWAGNLLGNYRFKEVMPKRILGIPTLYKFEDMSVYGAELYNDYLTRLYGNWRELPPKEKQKTGHDFLKLDLEKSYLIEE